MLSPLFAEAQDSLLAGSLGDLQNVNVIVEGVGISRKTNIIVIIMQHLIQMKMWRLQKRMDETGRGENGVRGGCE